ncbi:MAG: selenocysteine synthase [Bacteroidota bacterium]
MLSRRKILKRLSALPILGGLGGSTFAKTLSAPSQPVVRDYFKELGVRTFINAAGTYTSMTGSLMPKEVIDAIDYARHQYVGLDDLQDKVGARIAELLKCESAMVTAGAASAISLGTAGVLTGMDPEKAKRIPNDLSGMKSEVILQKTHRVGYDHAIRNCGVSLVEVETHEEMEAAINEKTAMLWFLNYANPKGQVKYKEFIALGKKYGIPTFNDCAADVPPVENLWKYTQMGFDLVCFSGGKGLRGPQSAGLLLGKKELIAAARLSAPPRGDTVCRTNKVNKEEILGMLVALELFLNRDHEAQWKAWETQIDHMHDAVAKIEGVDPEIHVPPIANHVPSLKIRWDQERVKITPGKVREALRLGHPSIETVGNEEYIGITSWMMNPGEERIVASRLAEILHAAG